MLLSLATASEQPDRHSAARRARRHCRVRLRLRLRWPLLAARAGLALRRRCAPPCPPLAPLPPFAASSLRSSLHGVASRPAARRGPWVGFAAPAAPARGRLRRSAPCRRRRLCRRRGGSRRSRGLSLQRFILDSLGASPPPCPPDGGLQPLHPAPGLCPVHPAWGSRPMCPTGALGPRPRENVISGIEVFERFAFGDFSLSIRGLRPLFVLHSISFLLNYYKTCLQPLSGWSPEKLT